MAMHKVFEKGDKSGRAGGGWSMAGVFPFSSDPSGAGSPANSTPAKSAGQAPVTPSGRTPNARGTISAPKCKGCQKPLQGQIVEWSNELYHTNCFKCSKCDKVISGCVNLEGRAYCQPCARSIVETKQK